ncbi:hypothetical protein GCM10023237_34410 [Streptomyces coeruleoprunus]
MRRHGLRRQRPQRRGVRRAVVVGLWLSASFCGMLPAYAEESRAPEPSPGASRGVVATPSAAATSASPEASGSGTASPAPGVTFSLRTPVPMTSRPSLAGRPAGEGRTRPGRPGIPSLLPSAPPSATVSEAPRTKTATATTDSDPFGTVAEEVPEEDSPAVVPPRRTPSAAAYERGPQAAETFVDRRVPVLTLGVGLAFMGLGIGFLGLRMRRR